MDWTRLLIAGGWGGLCALERRAFLQAMVSRPLVAATGMGVLLDDPAGGMFIGMVLELYYLGSSSLGAARPEHDTLAATGTSAAAACLAAVNGSDSTPAVWSLCLLCFVPLGNLGRALDRRLELHSTQMALKAMSNAGDGLLTQAMRQNLWAMWPHFAAFGAVTAICGLLGWVGAPWEQLIPLPVVRGLAWAFPAMASVAAAIAVRGANAKRGAWYAGATAVMVGGASLALLLLGKNG